MDYTNTYVHYPPIVSTAAANVLKHLGPHTPKHFGKTIYFPKPRSWKKHVQVPFFVEINENKQHKLIEIDKRKGENK